MDSNIWPKVGRKARLQGTGETPIAAFPAAGSIRYKDPWSQLARENCNWDSAKIADAFRAWCSIKKIALDAPKIEQKFVNFCASQKRFDWRNEMNTFLLACERGRVVRGRIKEGAGRFNAVLERERLRELSEIERGLTAKQLVGVYWLLSEYCYVGDWSHDAVVRNLADRRWSGWMRDVLLLVGTDLDKVDRDILLSRVGDRYWTARQRCIQ